MDNAIVFHKNSQFQFFYLIDSKSNLLLLFWPSREFLDEEQLHDQDWELRATVLRQLRQLTLITDHNPY